MADPVSVDRLIDELEKLKAEMDGGELKSGEYDQRLARIIQELRGRRIDAERSSILSALDEALKKGTITASVHGHLISRLGLI